MGRLKEAGCKWVKGYKEMRQGEENKEGFQDNKNREGIRTGKLWI